MINSKGQSLMELVVGIGLVAIVVSAISILVISSLRNSQFSEKQLLANNIASQNLEKVRTVKNSNFGVCLQNQGPGSNPATSCSKWEDLWAVDFGTYPSCATGCTFEIISNCLVGATTTAPICLQFRATRTTVGNLESQLVVEDEGNGDNEKKVTSRAFWTDNTGEHSSELITVLSRR